MPIVQKDERNIMAFDKERACECEDPSNIDYWSEAFRCVDCGCTVDLGDDDDVALP